MNDRILKLEETVAHLTRVIDELSDVLARQEAEIERLKRRQAMLMRRDAERELAEGGTVPPDRSKAAALVKTANPGPLRSNIFNQHHATQRLYRAFDLRGQRIFPTSVDHHFPARFTL